MNKFVLAFIVTLTIISLRSHALDKTYKIRCFHEFNTHEYRMFNQITIDSQVVTCFCGKSPCFVFISFGKLDCYCLNHARLALSGIKEEDFNG